MFSIGEKVRVLGSDRVGAVERVNDELLFGDDAVIAVSFGEDGVRHLYLASELTLEN